MLDRDQLKELHNSVTDLHKITSLAATGAGAVPFENILGLVIDVLNLVKSNFSTMQLEFRRSISEKPETIHDASKQQQIDHQEALKAQTKPSVSPQPRHPNTPEQAGIPMNIAESVKGNPPNPPIKAEGAPHQDSPVNNQNDPTNPPLNKIEQTKNEPPQKLKPTDLTIDKK